MKHIITWPTMTSCRVILFNVYLASPIQNLMQCFNMGTNKLDLGWRDKATWAWSRCSGGITVLRYHSHTQAHKLDQSAALKGALCYGVLLFGD